jgi:hypothetical protein
MFARARLRLRLRKYRSSTFQRVARVKAARGASTLVVLR